MRHITGENRHQTVLFPQTVDDYVPAESQVRFIDAFVDYLDLKQLGYTKARTKDTGRRPYNPADILKLYLYGYLHRVRSSRMLEKETHRNVEVMWLIKRLTPDFKTIADFRRENCTAIKNTFKEFNSVCRKAGMYKGELFAIDGSVFKAVNSKDRLLSKKKLNMQLADINKEIEAYLFEMDNIDAEEEALHGEDIVSAEKMQHAIEELKKIQKRKLKQLKSLQESGKSQIALTDQDAVLMQRRGKSSVVGYNVQTVVDDHYKMLIAYSVTNAANDKEQLAPMTKAAVNELSLSEAKVVADSGYFNGQHVEEVEKLGIESFIPIVNTSTNKRHGRFDKTHFTYNKDSDSYLCPAKEILNKIFTENFHGKQKKHYKTRKCSNCRQRKFCTTNKTGRVIYRYGFEGAVESLRERNKAHPEIQKKRKTIVEHPFGTLKRNWGFDHFLVKGKANVSGEAGLMMLAYNMKRVINTLGSHAQKELGLM